VPSLRIHISLPDYFIAVVDEAARGSGLSRSAFIRVALLKKMGLKSVLDSSPRTLAQIKERAFLEALDQIARELKANGERGSRG